ncbi:hypothetical protein [Spirilliplanes yamanashiensis]|uniref:Tat pathway signal sequence domain protein n=1 Tax=Spirilliplanes yamanashiensis TaxID=42233 RepID=A0A8J4DGU8_9ACTN|nr:hypothetical protein [Spirilliplanes yamanashiensis]MDP9819789.1 hypothetical protein [Spirilliplanes yamanashiensis]GIJ01391.1 hypothetical protein Sya03_07430 [Spirilliplanes yamanashiensis]
MPASSLNLGRRQVLALPAVAAAAAAAGSLGLESPAAAAQINAPRGLVDRSFLKPVNRAYKYLDTVQDAYFEGRTPRLLQSYNNEGELMTTAFVYDNALAICAYLANPTRENVRRARLIGDALLFAQANDEKYTDGRVRQAYAAGPMQFYGGGAFFPGLEREDGKAAFLWPFGFSGSATGDMAWVALAFVQLYDRTRAAKYLDAAVTIGLWITDKESPYRYGGYHGGIQADGETPQKWVSSEHNIDVYALFNLLFKHTRDRRWKARAAVAGEFVRSMWNRKEGFFWTGTIGGLPGEDPNLINKGNIPSDVQTWGLLSLREKRYNAGVDYVTDELWSTDGPNVPNTQLPAGVHVSGVAYASQSKVLTGNVSGSTRPNVREAVWLEGNGHTALALLFRGEKGDRALAKRLLRETVIAQEKVGGGQTVGLTDDPDGGKLSNPGEGGTWTGTVLPKKAGIVAATSAFDTGFAFGYFQRQHVGATSWFIMAALDFNPYA